MNLLHLEYFYTVAKEGGFLKASEKLRISQPAISRMVAELEHYLGFKLFERIGRNVRLTSRGEDVFLHCRKIFLEVENLKLSMGKIFGTSKGPLLIAASEPIASHFLPQKIATYLKDNTEVYPNIISGPAGYLLNMIEKGDVEMGFFFHTPELTERIVVERRVGIPFRLVVSKDFKKNLTTLSHFIGSREIDDLKTKRYPTLEILKKKYPSAAIRTSSNNLSAHKELVLRGIGVSVLPEYLIEDELKEKKLVDVFPDEKFTFQMKVLIRKNCILSLNSVKLLELI